MDLERLTESVFVVELKTSLALSLRTNYLKEFRNNMSENSIDWLDCSQMPYVFIF